MEVRHASRVAELHLAAFPGFFLSRLGRRFLFELYRVFSCDKSCIALVAEEPSTGDVLGFAVGTLKPSGFFRSLVRKRWWAFFVASLSAFFKDPRIALRLLRALLYRGDMPKDKERALLSSIAVIPEQRTFGLGEALLKGWIKGVREAGLKGGYLMTDALDNDAVNRFYIKNGWKMESISVTPEGRKMLCYVLDWE